MLSRLSQRGKKPEVPTEIPRKVYRPLPVEAKVSIGGWYPRTTLHLTEVFTFMVDGSSKLKLHPDKLTSLHQALQLQTVAREVSYLEYVHATTKSGIDIRFYEDGLYVLELTNRDIDDAAEQLEQYNHDAFQPALNFLFSLGAPTPPSVLSTSMQHPTVVSFHWPQPNRFEVNPAYGNIYSRLASDDLAVYKTHSHIFIASAQSNSVLTQDLVDMQLFFREYKEQLEQYLNLHRSIWDEVTKIGERPKIQPGQIERFRARVDGYQRIALAVTSRMNQMTGYAETRANLAQEMEIDGHLITLFQYKFATLTETRLYVQELWVMTTNYLEQTMAALADIQSQALSNGLSSLRTVVIIGVVASAVGWLTTKTVPGVSLAGVAYFVGLLLLALMIGWVVSMIGNHREYRLKFREPGKQSTK